MFRERGFISMFRPAPASNVVCDQATSLRISTRGSRLILIAVFALSLVLSASHSFAQAAPAGPQADSSGHVPGQKGTITLVLENWKDPVFWVIMALSVIGLTLIIQAFIKNRASVFMPEETTNQIREMVAQRKFKELIEFTETDDSFISKALNPALKRAPSFSSMKEAMETAIGEQTAEGFRRIEYLNIIGNLGPLLGLMGTVLGMIDAFSAMQAAHGDTNPAQLAGGISRALTHTFLGLFLALPCLAAFGILRTMVDRLTVRGALIAEELLLMIKPAEAKPAAAGAIAGATRTAATPQPAVVRKAPAMPAPAPIG
jgi:biopolymer transport protein ExbB